MKNKLTLLVAFLVAAGLVACSNYGKKVKVEGTKGEVYYKGSGVNESDARRLGDYLKNAGFFQSDKPASIQLVRDGDVYTVRFVYNKEYYEKNKNLEDVFKSMAVRMSKELFNGKKVNIALANNHMKDYTTIPYEEVVEKTGDAVPANEVFAKEDYEHESAGGVDFYWKGISDDDSKRIADYIVQNGAFAGGTSEIYMTKQGDRYFLRFPVQNQYLSDPAVVSQVEKVSKEIKDNVFPNTPYTFQITNSGMVVIRSFEY